MFNFGQKSVEIIPGVDKNRVLGQADRAVGTDRENLLSQEALIGEKIESILRKSLGDSADAVVDEHGHACGLKGLITYKPDYLTIYTGKNFSAKAIQPLIEELKGLEGLNLDPHQGSEFIVCYNSSEIVH